MKSIKIILIALFLSAAMTHLQAQEIVEPSKVQWYTIEQADSLFEVQPKPLFIDVYTEWCGWCKHMMKTTFANASIAAYMNRHFYPVRFDAETFDTITFRGKTYTNPGQGRRPKHDLAKYLMKGRYSFPTIVYMARNKQIFPVPGYQNIPQLEPFLVYFSEDLYTSVSLHDFNRYFKCSYPSNYEEKDLKTIPDSLWADSTGSVTWHSLSEAEALSKKTGKAIFMSIGTSWCQSCRISDSVNFRSEVIAEQLNRHFIPVRFNATAQDTITFFGNKFKPAGQFQPHELVRAYMKQNYRMPGFLFINNKGQQLTEIHGFLPPKTMETILAFFAEKAYISQDFKSYKRKYNNRVTY